MDTELKFNLKELYMDGVFSSQDLSIFLNFG